MNRQLSQAQCTPSHHQSPEPLVSPQFDLSDNAFRSDLLGGSTDTSSDTALLDWITAGSSQEAGPQLEEPAVLQEMANITQMTDPVARNLAITQMYHQTSNGMDQTLFPNAGDQGQTANWTTFAVWASNEAGRAIRGEGNWVMDVGNAVMPDSMLDDTTQALADGNNTVFGEIAPAFAMFSHNFAGDAEMDPEKFEAFTEWMRTEAPGRDEELGNETLIHAFSAYHEAMFETDPDRQQELILQANAQIGMHEQTRLQPYIEDAMPWGSRGFLTANAMHLHVPTNESGPAGLDFDQNYERLHLDDEVRDRNFWGSYTEDYPQALQSLDDPTVADTWGGIDTDFWNPTVGAENWANYDDRMTYIGELFRTNQDNSRLHNQPFTDDQAQQLLDRRSPE